MIDRGKILERALSEAQALLKYDIGESTRGLARKVGKKPSEIVKLNANENLFVPRDFLVGLLRDVAEEIDPRLYPIDESSELVEALGSYLKASPGEIVVGTGSDQLIELVSRMALGRGDEALSIAPTFSMYERCARIERSSYRAIPLREDFALDTELILAAVTPRTRLLFICSPNNPTANQFDKGEIKRLAESFDGFVVVDEAYAEFAEGSVIHLTRKLDNLIVLRTFSKAFGLAGLRLGYAVANPDLATLMTERLQLPFSVSVIALRLGLKLLQNVEVVESAVRALKDERGSLIERLNEMTGVRAFDSETSFVLFQVETSSDEVYEALLDEGVIVRNIGRVLSFDDCLRVAVAPSSLSERFLAALGGVLGEKNA